MSLMAPVVLVSLCAGLAQPVRVQCLSSTPRSVQFGAVICVHELHVAARALPVVLSSRPFVPLVVTEQFGAREQVRYRVCGDEQVAALIVV